jgi:hypothetical protein
VRQRVPETGDHARDGRRLVAARDQDGGFHASL